MKTKKARKEDVFMNIIYGIVDEKEWAECDYSLDKYIDFILNQINSKEAKDEA